MFIVGQKLLTHQLLIKCAAALDLEHPSLIPVAEEDVPRVAREIAQGILQGVLKRTQSGWSYHVITPYTPDPLKQIETALKIQKQHWQVPGHQFVPPQWFLQPYLPALIHLGELRTFVVDGALYYTVYTTPTECDPKTLAMTSGKFVRPLAAFGWVISIPQLSLSSR